MTHVSEEVGNVGRMHCPSNNRTVPKTAICLHFHLNTRLSWVLASNRIHYSKAHTLCFLKMPTYIGALVCIPRCDQLTAYNSACNVDCWRVIAVSGSRRSSKENGFGLVGFEAETVE